MSTSLAPLAGKALDVTTFVQPFGSTPARPTAAARHGVRTPARRRLVDRIVAELNRAA